MSQFDLITHTRDENGIATPIATYIRHCSKEHGILYERDGVVYHENGEVFKKASEFHSRDQKIENVLKPGSLK